jgi:hypothetical protein
MPADPVILFHTQETLMHTLSLFSILLILAVGLAVGFAAGCWFYRRQLRRDPAKLDAWAREIKLARQAAEEKLKNR